MNDPRDNDRSVPGSAGGQPGAADSGQPRKPRIEVLQRSPAAAPAPGPAHHPNTGGIGVAGSASPAEASWAAPGAPQRIETPPEGRRGRSRTMLLMLLAGLVIAGFLLYTYLSSERDAEYPEKGTQVSEADAELLGNPQADAEADAAAAEELGQPPAAASTDEEAATETEAEPEPAASSTAAPAAPRAAAPEPRPAEADETAEEPRAARTAPAESGAGASNTVRAFYSALSSGDGSSAAQLVVPAKRRSGPLSAGALSRYYSSFRRPLRLRSVTPVDADTVRVAYDYVLADGRECRGQAAVDVVESGGRSLVSGIRTRGPC